MYAFRNSGFTREQLTNLGVTGKDVPIAAQTPLFPPLISRPIEIQSNVALDYKITWKEDFRSHLFDIHSKSELNLNDDSYSNKVANALEKEHKKKLQFKFAWNRMPVELRPQSKRKAVVNHTKTKKVKIIPKEVVEEKLMILEQKEKENPEADERSVKGEGDSEDDLENEEETMEDQEMDEENDYGSNYFDNGENYNEEDDNLDEGCLSTEEIVRKRNRIFDFEKKKQRDNIGRIEKIEVRYLGTPKDEIMIMNKNLSTPYNCAQHINETKCNTSVVALVDDKKIWDMHRPLQHSCTLQLLNFKINDPTEVNKIFWRSCSFLLGAIMQSTFKESAGLLLHSFPPPVVRSGSFIHDIGLNDSNWAPTGHDLNTFRVEMAKLATENKKIERLEVSHDIALEIFRENPFKREQLPNISNNNNGVVTLYRVGDHIDISKGPMIASTGFVERFAIASVHKISNASDSCNLYRLQGVALPVGFKVSSFAFNILTDRAKKLNTVSFKSNEADEHSIDHPAPIPQRSAN